MQPQAEECRSPQQLDDVRGGWDSPLKVSADGFADTLTVVH